MIRVYFNTSLYDKIKIDLDYIEVTDPSCADIAITSTEPLFVDMFSNVKYVICPCTNSNHVEVYNNAKIIDLKGADILDNVMSTVEHTIFLILYLMKKNSLLNLKRDEFSENLSSKSIGIIGYGRIGKRVYDTLRAMGVSKVFFCDTKYPSLYHNHFNNIIENCDLISLHTSVVSNQSPIITEEVIKKMKKGIYLINTSRGSVIDEKALLHNINKFSGVALDVLQNNDNSPYRNRLLKHNHVLITPHYGGYTQYDVERTFLYCINRLKEVI